MNTVDFRAQAQRYAEAVRSGARPASAFERAAVARQDRDLERFAEDGSPYEYRPELGERVCKFLSLLPHVKGEWARPGANVRVKLEDWQCWFVMTLFSWVHRGTVRRRFRKCSLYLPRKNGKSFLAAGIGLYLLLADGEVGAEVYSGATTEKQAWEVFGPARKMALALPDLQSKFNLTVHARSMVRGDGSKFEPVIGKPGDGASPHCAIVDEYHEHDTAELYDTMATGMGARRQPLLLVITTAGNNLAGPCYDDWQTCVRILTGTSVADDHFCLLYTIDPEDDWTSEVALVKANPNMGVSVYPDYLQGQQRDAINNTRKQGTFKTKHLNVWVNARHAFVNMTKWAQNARTDLDWEAVRGRRCYVGMDLASKVDIASIVYLFPPMDGKPWAVLSRNYLPEATVEAPENEHYQGWRAAGKLIVTEGNIIDFQRIFDDLKASVSEVEIAELAYDPHQATMLVTLLVNEGFNCVEVRPTILNFSEPMKYAEALVRDGQLVHSGDPVETWMTSNVTTQVDSRDNVYPRKDREQNKIDFWVALCSAMARAMVGAESDAALDDFLKDPIFA